MKNFEKNSRKSNLLFYLTFFGLTLLLTFGGIYLYYTEEDRKLAQVVDSIRGENAQYKKISNDSIVSINERNIQEKENIAKKLKHNTNIKSKIQIKFKELLKEIVIDPDIDQETLELKTKEEKKEIIRKVLTVQNKLNKLKSAFQKFGGKTIEEINYLKEQKEWYKEFHPSSGKSEEDEEVSAELDEFLKHFYWRFRTEKNLPLPKNAQLIKDKEGKYYPPDEAPLAEIEQEINKLKSRYPHINFDKEAEINFLGFQGWIKDEDREKGTTTAGLTGYKDTDFVDTINKEPRFKICPKRDIEITLHKSFPFSRKGKEYNLWLTETNEGNVSIFIGWSNLIETIAHELAHAVINSTKIYYRNNKHKILEDGEEIDEGGHGILHRTYTKELKKMIKNDPKYENLKSFWFKK